MKYTITFDDGVVYTSPDIRIYDPGWASEEGQKQTGIREISLMMPGGKKLLLKGFEKYNFFVEASQALGEKGGAKIESFFFCGAWRGYVVLWEINHKTRQILKRMAVDGKEYHGTATRGWRMGLPGEGAKSGILSL